MQNLNAKYSEVKGAILEVKKLTATCCGIKYAEIDLYKSYYQDFKIYELEWDNFLEEYENKFHSDLEGLEYERFFPEIGDQILHFKTTPKIIIYKLLSFFDKNKKLELHKLQKQFIKI